MKRTTLSILATGIACLGAASAGASFAQVPAERIAMCEACHGKDGNSTIAGTPSIAGQPEIFLVNQLIFFREGLRASPVMQEVAKGMKDPEAIALSKHFAGRPVKVVTAEPADPKAMARGKGLAEKMFCGQCHLPKYQGRAQMPRLAAQREDYLADTMIAYRDNKRTGADTTMIGVLAGVTDVDIKALAHFLARQR